MDSEKMFRNEVIDVDKFVDVVLSEFDWRYFNNVQTERMAPGFVYSLYKGKRVIYQGSNVILFEKCEYCGSKSGTKRNLLGYECCLSCGGPV